MSTRREKVLHDIPLYDVPRWVGVRVQVVEYKLTTVKRSFITYQYYLVRGKTRAGISRHAAVMLGVKV